MGGGGMGGDLDSETLLWCAEKAEDDAAYFRELGSKEGVYMACSAASLARLFRCYREKLMPLSKSGGKKAREKNIKELISAGHDPKQAVAIAYDTQRKARQGKKKAAK
jgi:hypothetical protein